MQSITLTTYGKITLFAVANLSKGFSYEEAWKRALHEEGIKGKNCAQAAFVGLCRAGIITGSTLLPAKKTIKNRNYVIKGLLHLEKYPQDVYLPPHELWKRIPITTPVKQSGFQMDIAITLFYYQHYDHNTLKQFEHNIDI